MFAKYFLRGELVQKWRVIGAEPPLRRRVGVERTTLENVPCSAADRESKSEGKPA